jgi:guanine nucleotide exchange factor VAV
MDFDGDDEGLSMDNTAVSHVYFLSETRKFRSVVELVTFYSRNSLKESFNGLDTTLRFPIGEVFLVKAKFDFIPPADQKNMLPLKTGDEVG